MFTAQIHSESCTDCTLSLSKVSNFPSLHVTVNNVDAAVNTRFFTGRPACGWTIKLASAVVKIKLCCTSKKFAGRYQIWCILNINSVPCPTANRSPSQTFSRAKQASLNWLSLYIGDRPTASAYIHGALFLRFSVGGEMAVWNFQSGPEHPLCIIRNDSSCSLSSCSRRLRGTVRSVTSGQRAVFVFCLLYMFELPSYHQHVITAIEIQYHSMLSAVSITLQLVTCSSWWL